MTYEMTEDPADRARKYITSFEKTLRTLIPVENDTLTTSAGIRRVSETIQHYFRDSKFYLGSGKPATALASIAYAEGLLDALTFLGLTTTKPPEQPF